MRAVRVEHQGRLYAGVEEEDSIRVIPESDGEPITIIAKDGWDGLNRQATQPVRPADARLLAPVSRPSKVLCVGLNYRDHAIEQGLEPPDHPILFAKMPSAISGPGDTIPLHTISSFVDYEAELAVVIGRRVRGITKAQVPASVAGYMVLNDVSARDLQGRDEQWVRGKSLDGYAPTGPALVSPDEVGDPDVLGVCCWVNGELRQDSNTENLIFDVPSLVAFCAEAITLEPGDIIGTGTPGGVGVFMKPRRSLEAGDTVTAFVEKIGRLVNPVADVPG